MTERTLKEKHEDLVRRYNSMCEAADKNQAETGKLLRENSALKNDVIRLAAEARAAQQNAQLLGDDYNERARGAAAEVGELRSRLRANGLPTVID